MALEDLPLGGGAHVIDGDGPVMCPHREPLRLMMKRDHGKHLDHEGEDDGDDFVRVLPQCKLVRVKTLQQDGSQLNQVVLQVHSSGDWRVWIA